MWRNCAFGSAPSVEAARASTGSMPVMYDRISRNAKGNPEITSEISTPQKLCVSRIGPVYRWMSCRNCDSQPFGPK